MDNFYIFCGVFGNIKFNLKINNQQTAHGYITYSDRAIGASVVKWDVDFPYQIGGGLKSTKLFDLYEFEITGDPAAPITTTELPKTGSRTFSQYLTVTAKGPQFPAGRSYDQMLHAEVLAPTHFEENMVDKAVFQGKTGKFTGNESVGHARYTELPPAANGDKMIRIDFSGLPDDVPLVSVLNVAENIIFTPPPGEKPSTSCLSPHYSAGIEPYANDTYTLTGGYECKNSAASDNNVSGSRKRIAMVINYGNERFNRAIIFSGSNVPMSYNSFKVRSAGNIRNKQQLNKSIIAH